MKTANRIYLIRYTQQCVLCGKPITGHGTSPQRAIKSYKQKVIRHYDTVHGMKGNRS